jgi:ABC-type Mn2+/Zn2+ transport system permease subunit
MDLAAGSKIRISLMINPQAAAYVDQFDYPAMSFASNVFGLIGLYLGYCLLDIFNMWEKLMLMTVASLSSE